MHNSPQMSEMTNGQGRGSHTAGTSLAGASLLLATIGVTVLLAQGVSATGRATLQRAASPASRLTGQSIPIAPIIRRLPPKTELVQLVMMGECGSCSLHSLDPAGLCRRRGLATVFVFTTPPSRDSERLLPYGLVLADEGFAIGSAVNSQVTPLCMLLDTKGKVLWCGNRPGEFPFAKECQHHG